MMTAREGGLAAHEFAWLTAASPRRQAHTVAKPGRRADAKPPLIRLVGVDHVIARRFERRHGGLDLCGEDRPVRRQRHLPRRAHEKLDAEIVFQSGNGPCDRGGRQVELPRYLGKISFFGGKQEDAQGLLVVHPDYFQKRNSFAIFIAITRRNQRDYTYSHQTSLPQKPAKAAADALLPTNSKRR